MPKPQRKLTWREKAEKKRRRREYMTIFVHGKQKRVKRPPTIDGMDIDDFILANADPIWLHQNEMWEYINPEEWDSDLQEVDPLLKGETVSAFLPKNEDEGSLRTG